MASLPNASRILCSLLTLSLVIHAALGLPRSTTSRWLIDQQTGSRQKLACVNWAFHFTPQLAEGLHLHPLESIARIVTSWGFNCLRLSWATSCMFTNKTLAEARVAQTFRELGLMEALERIPSFNAKLVGVTTVEAFKEAVCMLGKEGLMVVLDNKVGDEDASVDKKEIWLKGWPFIMVVNLRYDFSQPDQDWHMQRGAHVFSRRIPELLIIHGGLQNAEKLHNLMMTPLWEGVRRKIVYELHIPAGQSAVGRCETVMQSMWKNLLKSTVKYPGPVVIGELRSKLGQSLGEFETCLRPWLSAFTAQNHMDWAVRALQGSYHSREGVQDNNESIGLFNHQWTAPRVGPLLHKSRALLEKPMIQDMKKRPHEILFHPASGLCVNKVKVNKLELGLCKEASSWKFLPQGLIVLDSTYLVIGAQGPNQAAVLDLQGTQKNGPWTLSNSISWQHMQLSTTLLGQTLCLDSPNPPVLLTNPCICIDSPPFSRNQHCERNPISQWFSFVSSWH